MLWVVGWMACASSLRAQHNLGAGGASATSAAGSVSFSLGQVAYTTSANASGSAARGVQQTYPELEIRVPEVARSFDFNFYPNPNRGTAYLQLPASNPAAYALYIHDLSGRLITVQTLSGGITPLDFSSYASGAYTAHIYSKDVYMTHFIFMKTN